jgi:hypothetical protein
MQRHPSPECTALRFSRRDVQCGLLLQTSCARVLGGFHATYFVSDLAAQDCSAIRCTPRLFGMGFHAMVIITLSQQRCSAGFVLLCANGVRHDRATGVAESSTLWQYCLLMDAVWVCACAAAATSDAWVWSAPASLAA